MRKSLLPIVLCLSSCYAPDVVGVEAGYGQGDADSHFDNRPNLDSDIESWWVAPYVEWHIGRKVQHEETLDAFNRLEIATVTGKYPQVEVIHDEPQPEKPIDKILYAVGAILVAVAGLIGVVVKRQRGKNNED